jgi:hypothetical protein
MTELDQLRAFYAAVQQWCANMIANPTELNEAAVQALKDTADAIYK